LVFASPVLAAEPTRLLQVRLGDATHSGKLLGHDAEHFWLLERDGRLDQFPIGDVAAYEPLSGRFAALSSAELRDRLVREFGRGYEVAGAGHYLVVAGRGRAKGYVAEFEQLYRHMYVYLSARGFAIHEPEFPLVAIVFPDRARFAEYCLQEQVAPQTGLMGYYLISSNRVALYESDVGALDHTIIHEAVHQVAFNIGLHRRMGANPLWVVEGLATAFEPEEFRRPLPSTPVAAKLNRERFARFRGLAGAGRPKDALQTLVAGDEPFQAATLDAYAEAWALTFYLLQTRQAQYTDYLKRIAARPALESYSAEARLEDFQKSFGKNLPQLEAEVVRFHQALD
jgi:hypothetical protein